LRNYDWQLKDSTVISQEPPIADSFNTKKEEEEEKGREE